MVTNYGYKIPVLKVVGLNPTGVTCLYIRQTISTLSINNHYPINN